MQQPYKILIHSKDPSFLEALREGEKDPRYEWIPLPTISELIPAVYETMPHLVIAELRVSNVAAFDILNEMKTDLVLEHIPLIVVSDTVKRQEVMDCGADLYLEKKIDVTEFLKEMHQLLSSKRHELDIHPLTRLPGSRSSVEEIESLIEQKKSFTLFSFHLRNLELFYERFGTRRGDSFVRLTAYMLRRLAQEQGGKKVFTGHLSPRDFIVTLPEERAQGFAERIVETFDGTVERLLSSAGDKKVKEPPLISIAIVNTQRTPRSHLAEMARACEQIHRYLRHFSYSTYLEDRRTDVREVASDFLMSAAMKKSLERKRVDLQRAQGSQTGILADLSRILKSKNIETHFQPIVQMKDKKVFAYEALTRFRRSDGTLIEPIRMFQAAREANTIKELDILCAITACHTAEGLPSDVKIFVNLNRETILDEAAMSEICNDIRIDVRRIVFEITEQSLVRELPHLVSAVQELRSRGIQIALDDAGGGSVSLREAAELKLEVVKFDQSLIQGIHESEMKQKILSSLIVFFQGIHALTVAEGIETQDDWDYLTGTGIQYGQGFFIARPAPLSVFQASKGM